MNIPPLTPPAVSPVDLPVLASATARIDVLAQPGVVGSASIVDVSKLGQLLSASTRLESPPIAADAVDRVAEQGASTGVDDGFARLVAAAQAFVEVFNDFQTGQTSNVQDPLVAPLQNVLLIAINELPAWDNENTLLASLAQVGINVQDAPSAVDSAQLTIDLTALESAFNANPAATSASVAQAFQAIGQIAAQLASQNVDLFISETDVAPPASLFDMLPVTASSLAANGADTLLQGFLADQAPVAANSSPAPSTTPLAAAGTALLQASLADQANRLAENPAPTSAPIAAALNAQIASANSMLPDSQFGASPAVLATASTTESAAGFPDTVDAQLQRSLADQALMNAFDANAATVPPASALPVETVATPATALAQTGELSEADQAANPMASTASDDISAGAGVDTSTTDTAQVPVALDDGRAPLALDPSVAAAVAAYRLGDGTVPSNKPEQPRSAPSSDIRAVSKIGALALDPHDEDARRNAAARNTVLALDEHKALATTEFPPATTVDVTI